MEITFLIESCAQREGFVARWDDPAGGGITTQGESLADLENMVADAVAGYFVGAQRPTCVRLHFEQDPIIAVA